MSDKKGVPLESFFAAENQPGEMRPNPAMTATLNAAQVIFGIDVMTRNEFLVYGRKALEKIQRTGKSKPLAVLYIEVDQEGDELEKLCAMVEVVKGRCDYRASQ
jgi:hypothetical protein